MNSQLIPLIGLGLVFVAKKAKVVGRCHLSRFFTESFLSVGGDKKFVAIECFFIRGDFPEVCITDQVIEVACHNYSGG